MPRFTVRGLSDQVGDDDQRENREAIRGLLDRAEMSDNVPTELAMARLRWEQARIIWKAARKAARLETRKFRKVDAEYQKVCAEFGVAPNFKED
jgi:hypothetical protein